LEFAAIVLDQVFVWEIQRLAVLDVLFHLTTFLKLLVRERLVGEVALVGLRDQGGVECGCGGEGAGGVEVEVLQTLG